MRNFYSVSDNGQHIEKLSGADLKALTGAPTIAAAADAIRNDWTGRDDYASVCFSYAEARALAAERKSRQ